MIVGTKNKNKQIITGFFTITLLFIYNQAITQKTNGHRSEPASTNYKPKYPLTRHNEGDKYGFIDQAGKTVIPFIYDAAGEFSEGLASVVKRTDKGYKYAYIDSTGKIIINWLPYHDAFEFVNGRAQVRSYNLNTSTFKYGYINKKGAAIIPVELDDASTFKEGIAFVKKGESRFAIDTSGKILFTLNRDTYYEKPEKGLIRIRVNNRFGYINKKGATVITPQYYNAGIFHNGICEVSDSLHWGVITNKGDTLVPFIFDKIDTYSKNLITVRIRDRAGFLNKNGQMVLPMMFDQGYSNLAEYASADKDGIGYAIYPQNGIFKVKQIRREQGANPLPQEETKNIIDEQDGYFLPSYPLATDELTPVVKKGLVGYINRNNKLVIPFQYVYAESFSGGLAAVSDGKKWGFIDTSNNLVIPMIYDKVLRFQADVTGVWIGNKYLTIKKNGEIYK